MYNMSTASEEGAIEGLSLDLATLGVDVCGLAEVRRTGEGDQILSTGWRFLWSGHRSDHARGVGALISPQLQRFIQVHWAPSMQCPDRLALLRLSTKPRGVAVPISYAPTESATPAAKDAYWSALRAMLASIPGAELVVAPGDYNGHWAAPPSLGFLAPVEPQLVAPWAARVSPPTRQ